MSGPLIRKGLQSVVTTATQTTARATQQAVRTGAQGPLQSIRNAATRAPMQSAQGAATHAPRQSLLPQLREGAAKFGTKAAEHGSNMAHDVVGSVVEDAVEQATGFKANSSPSLGGLLYTAGKEYLKHQVPTPQPHHPDHLPLGSSVAAQVPKGVFKAKE